jgi:hypothetical protein
MIDYGLLDTKTPLTYIVLKRREFCTFSDVRPGKKDGFLSALLTSTTNIKELPLWL